MLKTNKIYNVNTITQTPLLLQPRLTALQPFKANPIGLLSEALAKISIFWELPYQECGYQTLTQKLWDLSCWYLESESSQ